MKSLMLWKDDFKNERDWIALCKALDIPKDTVEIEMNCNGSSFQKSPLRGFRNFKSAPAVW